MTTPDKIYIAVIGAGRCSAEVMAMATETGRLIAGRGGILVCGGLGGVMEGAARGAREAGGITIGILPGDRREDANAFIDHALPTGLGEARNVLVVRAADAVIALPGEYGTLSEMAFALKMGKPVVSLSNWNPGEDVHRVETPAEAVELAFKLVGKGRP